MTRAAVVRLDHVSVSYRDLVALEDVSFAIQAGDFLAVVGPNGSGKTTLLKVLLGLVRPERGEVQVFGRAPWDAGGERWRIGYSPQVASVDLHFPVRAGEVVLMGRYGRIGLVRRPTAVDRAAAARAMERVGIADLADRAIAHLSGGQRQRVFLARALVAEPDLLLLDEPTTGVDVASTESLYELLDGLRKGGMTIVIVSHDIGVVASYVDAVACINRRLVAHGRPDEVLTSAALEQMYGCEAMLFHHGRMPHMVVEKQT
jgi:zinc transport system ATP-binding protein